MCAGNKALAGSHHPVQLCLLLDWHSEMEPESPLEHSKSGPPAANTSWVGDGVGQGEVPWADAQEVRLA